jgi:hypothetical protein
MILGGLFLWILAIVLIVLVCFGGGDAPGVE